MIHFKKLFFLCAVFAFSQTAQAQILTPVKSSTTTKKISSTEYEIRLTLTIEKGWKVYGEQPNDNGPVGFSSEILGTTNATAVGKMTSTTNAKVAYDDIFKMKVNYFTNTVTYVQRVKIKDVNKSAKFSFGFEFMTCDATKCLPPDFIEVTVNLNKK